LVAGAVPGVVRGTLETGIASSSTLIGRAAFAEAGHGDIENEPVAILGNVCRVGARRMQSDDGKVPGELLGGAT